MTEKLDLQQLAVNRAETPVSAVGPKRRWFSRYALPFAILLAFACLLAWATKDSLLPSQDVTVVPVVVAKAQSQQSGTPLFQAAGWVEPRPASVVVSSLAPGVIEELHVVAGQSIKKGAPLAKLLDADARIQLSQARAERELRSADVEAASAEVSSARLALENPVKLRADLAQAQSSLAQLDAELEAIAPQLESARQRLELAKQTLSNLRVAGEAVPGRVVRNAESQLATLKAEVTQLSARTPTLQRQRDALQRRASAVEEQLSLKLEANARLSAAEGAMKAAKARLLQSELAVEASELQMSRMQIVAPMDGRILAIHATPGMRVVGIDPHSEKGSSAVVTMYDPSKLQVRVDVRLEDLPQVQAAQLARIETASVPGGLEGKVVSVTSVADIQKNTLQVKVAVDNPPDLIRPEMLAQVTFLAPEQEEASAEEQDRLRMLVPRSLVSGGESDAFIWIANIESKTAERRSIALGSAGTDGLVEVVSGLTPTDKLISAGRETLKDNARIRITGDDQDIGINRATARVAQLEIQP